MTTERTQVGREIEAALGEVLSHVQGEAALPCRIVDDPAAEHILALRKRMKLSRRKFADRFGLDARALQDWEQGRRVPDRAARVLLTVMHCNPVRTRRQVTARATASGTTVFKTTSAPSVPVLAARVSPSLDRVVDSPLLRCLFDDLIAK